MRKKFGIIGKRRNKTVMWKNDKQCVCGVDREAGCVLNTSGIIT